MVLISVVMPTYNQEKYLPQAIESVLNQSFSDLELIIIDNKSTDTSREIIKSYQVKDNRIKTIFHKENEGASKSINDGIDNANGKYISIICSDDIWDKFKIEKQLKVLEEDNNLIVWNDGELIDANGKTLGITFTGYNGDSQRKKSGYVFEELIKKNFILLSSLTVKRENIGNIRMKNNLTMLCDNQFEVDLAKNFKFYYINELITKYRIHEKNLIKSNINKLFKDKIILSRYILDKYGSDLSNDLKYILNEKIIDSYFILNDPKKAKIYLFNGIKLKPSKMLNFVKIILYIVYKYKIINNIYKYITNHMYKLTRFKTLVKDIIKGKSR